MEQLMFQLGQFKCGAGAWSFKAGRKWIEMIKIRNIVLKFSREWLFLSFHYMKYKISASIVVHEVHLWLKCLEHLHKYSTWSSHRKLWYLHKCAVIVPRKAKILWPVKKKKKKNAYMENTTCCKIRLGRMRSLDIGIWRDNIQDNERKFTACFVS